MDLENIQNETNEGAIPNESETQQETEGVSSSDTVPQGQSEALDNSAQGGEGAETAESNEQIEPFLTFKYNHEERSLNREEAINAAQRGLKYGELSDKLDRIAAIKGVSPTEFIDGVIAAEREAYKQSISERLGDDSETVERLMKLYDIEQGEKYNQAVAERDAKAKQQEDTLNSRLATEFLILKAEFPEFSGYGDLPKEVRKEAENGKDLMSAYLLHKYKTEKAAQIEKNNSETAAKASTGSQSGEAENVSSEEKEFLKGLWG